MTDVQSKYRDAFGKVDQLYIKNGQGKKMNGVWYYMMNENELDSIKVELQEHLAL